MTTPTAQLIEQLQYTIALYVRNYHVLYGLSPQGRDLTNIVRNSLDTIDDPAIRAKLRASITIKRLRLVNGVCEFDFTIARECVQFLDKYSS